MVDRHALFHMPRDHLCHCLIDTSCAQTAAEGQDAHSVIETQLLSGSCLVHAGDAAAHRKTGHRIGAVRMQVIQCLLHSEHHMVHFLCQHLIGDTGKSVLLVDGARDSHMRCRMENRPCHIAAGANGDVRLELFQDLLGAVL